MVTTSAHTDFAENPEKMAGSSDITISTLFEQIHDSYRKARGATDLRNLQQFLHDINFELNKYDSVSLQPEVWKPRLEKFIMECLPSVKVPPMFALDVREVENDTVSMIQSISSSLVYPDGINDVSVNLPWHVELAASCAKVPDLPRIRAYGYWKIGDLGKDVDISMGTLSIFVPIMAFLVGGFLEDDSSIACAAEESVLFLTKHFNITNVLHPNFQIANKFMEIIDKQTKGGSSDVVKFRIFDFVDKLLVQNSGNLSDVLQLGIMEHLYSAFRSMDLLILANNCEALCQFAKHSAGLQLLEESGGIKLAEELLTSKKDSAEFEYFGPYLMRMYIILAMNFPEYCILKCEKITIGCVEMIFSRTGHSSAAALEYFGRLSCSSAGKRYLHNFRLNSAEMCMEKVLKFVGKVVSESHTKTPLNDACVHSLELFFKKIETSDPSSAAELEEINSIWFGYCGNSLFPSLFRQVRTPFKDVKMPVLDVILSMADQRWGLEKFRDESGFIDYLLNRSAEADRDVKEKKYTIIVSITNARVSREVFDSVSLIRLREYIRDGPFYLQGDQQVAFEGGA